MANHGSATKREETPHVTNSTYEPRDERIELLTRMICGAGDEAAAALLVLMAMFENAEHPTALANTVKHLAFTHCGELNLYGMVDAQIAMLDEKLLASNALVS